MFSELTYRETKQQAGLAHARVSDEEQFEQVVAGRERGQCYDYHSIARTEVLLLLLPSWGNFFVPDLGRVCVAHTPG